MSVQEAGYFIFRFKTFDIFTRSSPSSDSPVLAELFSSRFRMYSTKNFPGLKASTP
jgi:hypothetical protein